MLLIVINIISDTFLKALKVLFLKCFQNFDDLFNNKNRFLNADYYIN